MVLVIRVGELQSTYIAHARVHVFLVLVGMEHNAELAIHIGKERIVPYSHKRVNTLHERIVVTFNPWAFGVFGNSKPQTVLGTLVVVGRINHVVFLSFAENARAFVNTRLGTLPLLRHTEHMLCFCKVERNIVVIQRRNPYIVSVVHTHEINPFLSVLVKKER